MHIFSSASIDEKPNTLIEQSQSFLPQTYKLFMILISFSS